MRDPANQMGATCEGACSVCDLFHVQLIHGGTRGNKSNTAAVIALSFFLICDCSFLSAFVHSV